MSCLWNGAGEGYVYPRRCQKDDGSCHQFKEVETRQEIGLV